MPGSEQTHCQVRGALTIQQSSIIIIYFFEGASLSQISFEAGHEGSHELLSILPPPLGATWGEPPGSCEQRGTCCSPVCALRALLRGFISASPERKQGGGSQVLLSTFRGCINLHNINLHSREHPEHLRSLRAVLPAAPLSPYPSSQSLLLCLTFPSLPSPLYSFLLQFKCP